MVRPVDGEFVLKWMVRSDVSVVDEVVTLGLELVLVVRVIDEDPEREEDRCVEAFSIVKGGLMFPESPIKAMM